MRVIPILAAIAALSVPSLYAQERKTCLLYTSDTADE